MAITPSNTNSSNGAKRKNNSKKPTDLSAQSDLAATSEIVSSTNTSSSSMPVTKKANGKSANGTQTVSAILSSVNSQNNKKYQKFKKLFEKTALQKRQAQANTILSNQQKQRSLAAATALTSMTMDEEGEASSFLIDNNEMLNNPSSHLNNNESQCYYEMNFSKESLRQKQEYFDKSLNQLYERLDLVKKIGTNANCEPKEDKDDNDEFQEEYLSKLSSLENEATNDLQVIKIWHEKQKTEIDHQYRGEQKLALKEFKKKRADLKKKLRNKYEEMRKQLESDRSLIDINMDLNEICKLPRTRNLRKRITNTNALMYNFDYSIDWLNLDILPNGSSKSGGRSKINIHSTSTLQSSSDEFKAKVTLESSSTTTMILENNLDINNNNLLPVSMNTDSNTE